MKFIVTTPVPTPDPPKDSFVLEIEVMQGDADGYRTFTLKPFKKDQDEASLQSVLETLQRMEKEYSYDTHYKEILGWQQWFGEVRSFDDLPKWFPELLEKYDADVHQEIVNAAHNRWCQWNPDPVYGYNVPERLNKYQVFYYDHSGIKFNVQFSS